MSNHNGQFNPTQWSDFVPHLTADDLRGKAVTLVIEQVDTVEVYDKKQKELVEKPILRFAGKRKYLILSPINQGTLRAAFGPAIADSLGQTIVVKVERIKAFGEDKTPIRISLPSQPNGETPHATRHIDMTTGEVVDGADDQPTE